MPWHQLILVFILGAIVGAWASTMAVMTGPYHAEQPGTGLAERNTPAP